MAFLPHQAKNIEQEEQVKLPDWQLSGTFGIKKKITHSTITYLRKV